MPPSPLLSEVTHEHPLGSTSATPSTPWEIRARGIMFHRKHFYSHPSEMLARHAKCVGILCERTGRAIIACAHRREQSIHSRPGATDYFDR